MKETRFPDGDSRARPEVECRLGDAVAAVACVDHTEREMPAIPVDVQTRIDDDLVIVEAQSAGVQFDPGDPGGAET